MINFNNPLKGHLMTEIVETGSDQYVAWRSVTGQTFRVRLKLADGTKMPPGDQLITAVVSAFSELVRGGDPAVVLDAFRTQFVSMDGLPIWPVPSAQRANLDLLFESIRPTQKEIHTATAAATQPKKQKRIVEPGAISADAAKPVGRQNVTPLTQRVSGQLGNADA